MSRRNINRGRARLEHLRAQSLELASERAKRTHEQQLELLDSKLGEGVGASRERARLASLIEERDRKKRERKKVDDKKSSRPVARGERRKAKARRQAEREKASR